MSELIEMNPETEVLKEREKECLECEEYGHCTRTTIYKFDGWCFKHPMKDKE